MSYLGSLQIKWDKFIQGVRRQLLQRPRIRWLKNGRKMRFELNFKILFKSIFRVSIRLPKPLAIFLRYDTITEVNDRAFFGITDKIQ